MLPKEQIEEFREYLKKSENPLFLFDDDPDGTSAYLLLKKYINKGKGVMVKAKPFVGEDYLKKVEENSPDLVVILDMPIVDQDFIDKVNVPILWLDHHQPIKRKGVHYYNPRLNSPVDNNPTTYYAYKIAEDQNTWIAAMGCFADWYYPDFIEKIYELYPGLIPKKDTNKPEEILFDSRLGDLIRTLSFLLKGSTTEVNRSISIFSKLESPFEILDQTTPRGKYLYNKVSNFRNEYKKVLAEASEVKEEDGVLYINHPKTQHSFVSELSTELSYRTKKTLIVAREDNGRMKMSIRSTYIKLPDIVNEALIGLDGYGGGHELACGASINTNDFPEFLERFKNLIKKKSSR
jgi:single-stranded DNA-specific DHH superfamily exonuclease